MCQWVCRYLSDCCRKHTYMHILMPTPICDSWLTGWRAQPLTVLPLFETRTARAATTTAAWLQICLFVCLVKALWEALTTLPQWSAFSHGRHRAPCAAPHHGPRWCGFSCCWLHCCANCYRVMRRWGSQHQCANWMHFAQSALPSQRPLKERERCTILWSLWIYFWQHIARAQVAFASTGCVRTGGRRLREKVPSLALHSDQQSSAAIWPIWFALGELPIVNLSPHLLLLLIRATLTVL